MNEMASSLCVKRAFTTALVLTIVAFLPAQQPSAPSVDRA